MSPIHHCEGVLIPDLLYYDRLTECVLENMTLDSFDLNQWFHYLGVL